MALDRVLPHTTCWAGRLGVGFVLSPQPVYPRPGEPGARSAGGLGESCPCGPTAVGGRPHGHWLVSRGRGRGRRLPATKEEALLSPAATGNTVWSHGSHRWSGCWHIASCFLPEPLCLPLSLLCGHRLHPALTTATRGAGGGRFLSEHRPPPCAACFTPTAVHSPRGRAPEPAPASVHSCPLSVHHSPEVFSMHALGDSYTVSVGNTDSCHHEARTYWDDCDLKNLTHTMLVMM